MSKTPTLDDPGISELVLGEAFKECEIDWIEAESAVLRVDHNPSRLGAVLDSPEATRAANFPAVHLRRLATEMEHVAGWHRWRGSNETDPKVKARRMELAELYARRSAHCRTVLAELLN